MKNAFVLIHAIFGTSYTAAAAAEVIGILPFSVLNFPVFIACYTAAGILAVAFADYSRTPTTKSQRALSLPAAKTAIGAEDDHLATLGLRTLSA